MYSMLTKTDLKAIQVLVREEVRNEIRNEINPFKDEMYSFRDDMYSFRDEIYSFRDEMYAFTIAVKNQFDRVDSRFDKIENILEQKADKKDTATKIDIQRIEGYMLGNGNRLDKLEDDMRLVKTKLKLV